MPLLNSIVMKDPLKFGPSIIKNFRTDVNFTLMAGNYAISALRLTSPTQAQATLNGLVIKSGVIITETMAKNAADSLSRDAMARNNEINVAYTNLSRLYPNTSALYSAIVNPISPVSPFISSIRNSLYLNEIIVYAAGMVQIANRSKFKLNITY